MNEQSLNDVGKRTVPLMLLGMLFALLAVLACNPVGALGAAPEEMDDGDDYALAIAQDAFGAASYGVQSGEAPCTTATALAAALSVGSDGPVATGDDATGIVTVTGPCDGVDGAGLDDIDIVPGAALSGITFDGANASIVMSAEAGGSLTIASSDVPFTIRGEGAITASGSSAPLIVGAAGETGGVLVLASGVTVHNTSGRALFVNNGTCTIQKGATVLANGSSSTVRIGNYSSSSGTLSGGTLTVAGTVTNTENEALSIVNGSCTVEADGVLECNTSHNYMGMQVGSSSGTAESVSTLTLNGGTIRDTAGEEAYARTVGVFGNPAGGKATFTMNGGEITGGTASSATIKLGRNSGDVDTAGALVVNGGEISNPNDGFNVNNQFGSTTTVTGRTWLRGGILVDEGSTGKVSLSGLAIATGEPALEVLSPDATVTIGAVNGEGPALSALGENTVVVAEGCKATVLSGSFTPNSGQATIADSVTAAVRIQSSTGQTAEIYGNGMWERINPNTFSTVAILRATGGEIALPSVNPGTTVSDATGGDGEIGVMTPYGVVTVGPGLTGVVPGIPANAVTVHRLYNPYLDGAHLLTADTNEVAELEKLGWQDEGARFMEYSEAAGAMTTVYRLYNPNNGDHFFTASDDEATALESIGWTREGIAWYAPSETTIPAYRLYNPYQTALEGLGNHLWTTLENERDSLVELGWQSEGIGWYALPLD